MRIAIMAFVGLGLLFLGCREPVKVVTPTATVPTATPVVVVPYTQTPTPTVGGMPTATAVPFTPTSQPTLSPIPVTPTPTATPVTLARTPTPLLPTATPSIPACDVIPVRGFGQVWFQNPIVREYLGCPSYPSDERAMENYAVQRFERGVMLWVQQSGFWWEWGKVLVMFQDDMSFARVSDTWRPEQAEPSPQVPPEGLYEPRGRFGKVWREGAGIKARLGWAIEPEKIGGPWSADPAKALNGAAQGFQRGVMYWIPHKAGTPQYGDDRWIYVLVTLNPDRSPRYQWLAFADTWQE